MASPAPADRFNDVAGSIDISKRDNSTLDGDWIDSTATYPSGDGAAGSDFAFRFNVVPGDVNRDGVTNSADLLIIRDNKVAEWRVYEDTLANRHLLSLE